ncbi:hypothetical protein D3C87_1753540 [compost metagenome]
MAVGVVDALEIVHVHVEQRGVAVLPARAGAYALKRHLQPGTVGQPGQRIFVGAAFAGPFGHHGRHQDAVQPM